MKTLLRALPVLLLLLALLNACSRQAVENPGDRVTVQLKWLHQAQFADFYVADHKGWYADEGLAVILVEGGPEIDVIKPVIEGTAQFGIAAADEIILARAAPLPGRAVATHPLAKTLFVSGYTPNSVAPGGALELGGAFLQKPFSTVALARKVRTLLEGWDMTNTFAAPGKTKGKRNLIRASDTGTAIAGQAGYIVRRSSAGGHREEPAH